MKMENNRLNHYATIDAYKTYVNMFVFMMLFYVAFYIIIFVLGSINSEIVNSEYIIYLEILVSPLLFCSLFFWQNRGKRYNTWNIIGIDNRIKVKPCLLAIVLAIGCLIFFANFSTMLDSAFELIGFNPQDDLELVRDNIGFLFINIFMLALLPAVFEELIFRGIIYKGLAKEHSAIFAIMMSSVMFSLMHGSLQQTIFQFVIGVVLGMLMYATGNIIYPIIMHFVNNMIIVIIDFFTYTGEKSQYIFNFWSIFVPILLAIIGAILLVVMYKLIHKRTLKQHTSDKEKHAKTWSTYSFEEKCYVVCGGVIAMLIWVSNTITMFGVS